MLRSLYVNSTPKNVLVIGLGGGILPMAIHQLLPDTKIDTVEIDSAVVDVAKKYFSFRESTNVIVHTLDGRLFVQDALKSKKKYDLVLLDAFDNEYIPEHLLTQEFLLEVNGILADNGVLAANTFANSRLGRSEAKTYYSVFGPFSVLTQNGNSIFILRRNGLPSNQSLRANAALLNKKLGLLGVEPVVIEQFFKPVQPPWPEGTPILTDQHSPGNLLNSTSG
jgi:spermidine synthase